MLLEGNEIAIGTELCDSREVVGDGVRGIPGVRKGAHCVGSQEPPYRRCVCEAGSC